MGVWESLPLTILFPRGGAADAGGEEEVGEGEGEGLL